jgi:uncharacterized protein YjbJ (UPF0337 family)
MTRRAEWVRSEYSPLNLPRSAIAGFFLHVFGTTPPANSFINAAAVVTAGGAGLGDVALRGPSFRTYPASNHPQNEKGTPMDSDRIKGAAKQHKGAVKEAAGKLTGDAKLKAEGKTDKTAGEVQSAVGGLKDTLRGK